MAKPLPEIEACKCRCTAWTTYSGQYFYVECGDQECRAIGPERKTERGAILAWNRAQRKERKS